MHLFIYLREMPEKYNKNFCSMKFRMNFRMNHLKFRRSKNDKNSCTIRINGNRFEG